MATFRGPRTGRTNCGATYRTQSGQGATEYLVLLAVVLIVALVSVALLGFFPGMASDARITQSNAYWKAVKPFSITEHTCAGTICTLVIHSKEASGQYTITSLNVGACTPNATSTPFSPGESKPMSIGGCPNGASGQIYDMGVNFTYSTPSNAITGARQYGAKSIIGKYA